MKRQDTKKDKEFLRDFCQSFKNMSKESREVFDTTYEKMVSAYNLQASKNGSSPINPDELVDISRVYQNVQDLEEQTGSTVSVISALEDILDQADGHDLCGVDPQASENILKMKEKYYELKKMHDKWKDTQDINKF